MGWDTVRKYMACKGKTLERGAFLSLSNELELIKYRKDMNHYASPIVKVSFEGPDIRDETLYDLLRVSLSQLVHPICFILCCSSRMAVSSTSRRPLPSQLVPYVSPPSHSDTPARQPLRAIPSTDYQYRRMHLPLP